MKATLKAGHLPDVPVSVVVPCYRCSDTIERAVSSVVSQTARPREILLIDDSSNDATLEKLFELSGLFPASGIRVFQQTVNKGPSAARNLGWSRATQPFVAFLDADDSWHPQKLERQYSFMKTHDHIVLTGHACGGVSNEAIVGSYYQLPGQFYEITATSLLFKNRYLTPSVMLRKDVSFRFCEKKRFAEDYLLWLNIALAGGSTAYSDEELAFLHKPAFRTTGLSSRLLDMEIGELDVFRKLYKDGIINIFLFNLCISWSLIKYMRRVFISGRFR